MIFDKVREMLDNSGFDYKIHSHEPVTTVEEAREKVPHLTKNLLKTVVFKIDGSHWILAAVSCNDIIHYKNLADAFSINRKKLRSISPDQVESELGFEVGGVGPFPVADNVRVVIDNGVLESSPILCGSGLRTRTVEIDINDLIKLSGATVSHVVKP